MASSSWSTLYDEVKSGNVAAIPESTYNVEVAAARPLATSRILFLDLRVEDGPQAGRIAQVNLYLPEPGNRGAGFHFRNKIVGFGDLSETFRQMDSAVDIAGALDILADALTGKHIQAEIELRSDGDYAGTNQLKSTKPSDTPTPAAVAAVAAAPAAPVSPVTAEPVAVDVTAASAALDAEVPF